MSCDGRTISNETESGLDNCIFCKIIARKIPADIVFEDDDVLAFKDIHPVAPVHLLLIPKKHLASLADCALDDTSLLGKMLLRAPQLAKEAGCELAVDAAGTVSGGFKTQINTGPDGGQEVYHLHLHIIGGPRPWGRSPA